MTTTHALTSPFAGLTFIPVFPESNDTPPLPECPDGSGDLWWDNASYINYQAYDPYADWMPERIAGQVDSPNYCDGPAPVLEDPPF